MYRFRARGVFNHEFLEIYKSVLKSRIFLKFVGSRLSIGGVKLQNEFATAEINRTKVWSHDAKKSTFLWQKPNFRWSSNIETFGRRGRFRALRHIFPALPVARLSAGPLTT